MAANKKIDLSKLKEEIHDRKQAKGEPTNEQQNQSQGSGAKDQFLNSLVESLNSGQQSKATNLIKQIDYKASGEEGESSAAVSNTGSAGTVSSEVQKFSGQNNTQPTAPPSTQPNSGGNDREAKLHEEFERKKKELFGSGANAHSKTTTSQYPQQIQQSQQSQGGQVISEAKLYETIDNVISEKFATVVEQAMKDSIVQIYSEARMKEVLEENKDTVRKIVIDVIKELQSKKKS